MLEAKKIEAGDRLTCRNANVFSMGCFHAGCKYEVIEIKNNVVYLNCEAEMKHNISYKDIGHFFRIPILIKRNIPNWL